MGRSKHTKRSERFRRTTDPTVAVYISCPTFPPLTTPRLPAKTLRLRKTLQLTLPQPAADVDTIWSDPALSEKIRRSCEIARAHGYRYLWIDSCCIDKTSSSELSEAINSMYIWYRDASVCYAYLSDVLMDSDPDLWKLGFRMSRWFTRGWTLQELVAPRNIVFLTTEWLVIGTKVTLVADIELVTGIESDVLMHRKSLDEVSVARRMCWAATRQTTRVEDEAYSLLGIFDINMPTLYGEGDRAFRRLQEEILKRIPDQSIFVWDTTHPYTLRYLEPSRSPADGAASKLKLLGTHTVVFARSPHGFFRTGSVSPLPHDLCRRYLGLSEVDHPLPDYTESPYGLRTHFPMLSIARCFSSDPFRAIEASHVSVDQWFLVILGCRVDAHREEHLLARLCYLDTSRAGAEVLKDMGICSKASTESDADLFVLTPADIDRFRTHLEVKTVYLPHPNRALPPGVPHVPEECPDVALSPWTSAVLEAQGYRVEHFGPTQEKPDNHQFALTRDGSTLCLELQFSPQDCHLMVWFSRVNADVPDRALPQPRKIKYLIHKDGFAPIDMRTSDGGGLTLQASFEIARDPEKTLFYFLVEVGAGDSYQTPSLPVLRVQDRVRYSGEHTLLNSTDRVAERGGGEDDSSSDAGRDGRGQHEQSWTTLGRKMDDKMKGWWSSRRGERKAVP
ncbi:HET-domain-containing protein [Ganoderma leucocontextum]|nr:HET-domain-containing protein [Ganoderma leucocontextum]